MISPIFKRIFKKWVCIHCGKIVWFWENEYLGLTKSHARCDRKEFRKDLLELGERGFMTKEEVVKNMRLREQAYLRPYR